MTAPHKQKTYQRGLRAEMSAVWYLRLNGYKILEQRYKTKVGEIDIIAIKGNQIIFIEVKARPSVEAALESITPTMKNRIEKTALTYISKQNNLAFNNFRFDVIAILPFKWSNFLRGKHFIHHLDNAWETSA